MSNQNNTERHHYPFGIVILIALGLTTLLFGALHTVNHLNQDNAKTDHGTPKSIAPFAYDNAISSASDILTFSQEILRSSENAPDTIGELASPAFRTKDTVYLLESSNFFNLTIEQLLPHCDVESLIITHETTLRSFSDLQSKIREGCSQVGAENYQVIIEQKLEQLAAEKT